MKEIKEIKNIYICLDTIEDNQIIKKILVEFMDNTKDYFMLSDCYYKNNFKKQDKLYHEFEKEIEPYINKALETDYKSGQSKLIMVHSNDEMLNSYVEKCITDIDKDENISSENLHLTAACFSSLLSFLSPYSFFKFFALSTSAFALSDNLSYMEDKKSKRFVKKVKALLSLLTIVLQIDSLATGISDLSINSHEFTRRQNLKEAVSNKSNFRLSHENPFSSKIQVFEDDEVDGIIMNAIENNSNLNSEDLSVAKSLVNYIEDNPYFDYEILYENLSSFSVVHSENYDCGNVASYYSVDYNVIEMLQDSYLSDEWYQKCLRHEIIHATGYLDNLILSEGMTAILEDEYGEDNSFYIDDYHDHRLITKIFCELITPDKMLEAFSKRDMSIIHDEMLKIYDDEETYQKLMSYFENYGTTYQDKKTSILSDSDIPFLEYPKYQIKELLTPYIENSNISEKQKNDINIYLAAIGDEYYLDLKSYFNYRLPDYSREFESHSIQKTI